MFLHVKDLSIMVCGSKYLFYLFQKYIYSNTYVQCLDLFVLWPTGCGKSEAKVKEHDTTFMGVWK